MTRAAIMAESERGAALLTVLLLVSVIAVIAATSLDRLRLSTRLTGNVGAMMQANAFLGSAENVALSQAAAAVADTAGTLSATDAGFDAPRTIPVDDGMLTVKLADGGNCFNLNGLVRPLRRDGSGPLVADKTAIATFVNLMQLVGIDANSASEIAASSADWIDADSAALPGGAEDVSYRNRSPGYLPPNGLMSHASELKAVNGVDALSWQRIEPYVCALPQAGASTINVNTLRPDQAVLLSMLDPAKLPPGRAKSLLANRPAGGYASLLRFWARPELAELKDQRELVGQTSVISQYFLLEAEVDYGGIMAGEQALIDASKGRPYIVWRQERVD